MKNIKICRKCNKPKPLTEFFKSIQNRDGLYSYCKQCANITTKSYFKTEKGTASRKKYFAKIGKKGYFRFGKGAIPILKHSAKIRNIPFNLTSETLETWWKSNQDICYYCGLNVEEYVELRNIVVSYSGTNFEILKFRRFYRNKNHKAIHSMTIDRKDNTKGYEINNIVKACWFCNSLKNDFFTENHFKIIAPEIISKLKDEIKKERITSRLS